MNKLVEELDEKDGETIDLQSYFFRFTMDSIEQFFMGKEVNTVQGEMSEYARAFDQAHKSMIRHMTNSIITQFLSRLFLPWPFGTLHFGSASTNTLIVRLQRTFCPDYQSFKKNIDILDVEVGNYIEQTRRDPLVKQRKDIIANFLNSSIGDTLTDKTIRDLVVNLTIAGRDTTACALSWLFYELTENQNVQEKLFMELNRVLEGKVPKLEDLETENLPYLNGTVMEALRLHPPVPTNQKACSEATSFEGIPVPPTGSLLISTLGLGRNPLTYQDPLKFDPDRWIPFVQQSAYEFPVFQAGPRACLGKDMAMFEMKLAISMLVQKFKFEPKPGGAEKVLGSFMLTNSIANDDERKNLVFNCLVTKRRN